MNTISSSKPLKEDFERRYRKNLEMLNPNAAGLDLHKEEIWVCPGGFQDNHEPEVKTFGTLTGELRKLVAYLKEKKVTAVAMEATALEGDCFATHTILTALDKAGRFDLVLRIIRERWGKRWASLGYTSTPEHWARFYCDGDRNNFPSHSHGWSGGPAELLTHQLLGIEIVVPGFKTIRINPKSPGFDVNVELSTPSGIIRGECRKNQWKLSLPDKIKILPNRSVYCPH